MGFVVGRPFHSHVHSSYAGEPPRATRSHQVLQTEDWDGKLSQLRIPRHVMKAHTVLRGRVTGGPLPPSWHDATRSPINEGDLCDWFCWVKAGSSRLPIGGPSTSEAARGGSATTSPCAFIAERARPLPMGRGPASAPPPARGEATSAPPGRAVERRRRRRGNGHCVAARGALGPAQACRRGRRRGAPRARRRTPVPPQSGRGGRNERHPPALSRGHPP